jgi:hypothetical protein
MMSSMNPDQPQQSELGNAPARRAPRWNIVSVALPVLAAVIGLLMLAANPSGRGDYGGALGGAVLLVMGVAAACGLGVIATVVALVRQERMPWLTAIGLIGNGAVLVLALGLLLRG